MEEKVTIEAGQAIFNQLVCKQKTSTKKLFTHHLKALRDATLEANLFVSGSALCHTVHVAQNSTIDGQLTVLKQADVGPLLVSGHADVVQSLQVGMNTTLLGELYVSGSADIQENLWVSGEARVQDQLTVQGAAHLCHVNAQSLKVSGDTTLLDCLYVQDSVQVKDSVTASKLLLTGGATLGGDVVIRGKSTLGDIHCKSLTGGRVCLENVQIQDGIQTKNLQASQHINASSFQSTTARVVLNLQVGGNCSAGNLDVKNIECQDIQSSGSLQVQKDLQVQGAAHVQKICADEIDVKGNLVTNNHMSQTLQTTTLHAQEVNTQKLFSSVCETSLLTATTLGCDSLQATKLAATHLTTESTETKDLETESATVLHDLTADSIEANTIKTNKIHVSEGKTLSIDGLLSVQKLATKHIQCISGQSITIGTHVNILGDLTVNHITASQTVDSKIARPEQILPPLDKDSLILGDGACSIYSPSPLHVQQLRPLLNQTQIHYGNPVCNNVFENRITTPSVYTGILHSHGSDTVQVKPNLAVQGALQTAVIRSKDSLRFETNQGKSGLLLDLKACEDKRDAHTSLRVPARLDIHGGKSRTVKIHDTLEVSHIHAPPGQRLQLQSQQILAERVQAMTSTTLAFVGVNGKKRAQFDLTGPGAVLQTTDGGPLTVKSRGGEVLIPSPLKTASVLPSQDSHSSLGKSSHRWSEVHTQQVCTDHVVTSTVVSPHDQLQLGELTLQQSHVQCDSDLVLQPKTGTVEILDQLKTSDIICHNLDSPTIKVSEVQSNLLTVKGAGAKVKFDLGTEHSVITASPLIIKTPEAQLEAKLTTQDIYPDQASRHIGTASLPFDHVYTNNLYITSQFQSPSVNLSNIQAIDDSIQCHSHLCVDGAIEADSLQVDSATALTCTTRSIQLPEDCDTLNISTAGQAMCLNPSGIVTSEPTFQLPPAVVGLTSISSDSLDIQTSNVQMTRVRCDSLTVDTSLSVNQIKSSQVLQLDQVSTPQLTTAGLEAIVIKTNLLIASDIQATDSSLKLGDTCLRQHDYVTSWQTPAELVLEPEGCVVIAADLEVQGALGVDVIDVNEKLLLNQRFSIQPGTDSQATILCAEDAQNIILDAYTVHAVNNLHAEGVLTTSTIWPRQNDIEIGLDRGEVHLQGNVTVSRDLRCQQVECCTVTADNLQVHKVLGDLIMDTGKLVASHIETKDACLKFDCGGVTLDFRLDRNACRINTHKKLMVLEAPTVRVIDQLQVQGQLTALLCTSPETRSNKLRTNRLECLTKEQLQVCAPLQLESGLQGKNNLLTVHNTQREPCFTVDTTTTTQLVGHGGLRLTTDQNALVTVERSCRTQDLLPDTRSRKIGTVEKPYLEIHGGQLTTQKIVSVTDSLTLEVSQLHATTSLQITTPGPFDDICLSPGSGLVQIQQDLTADDLFVNRLLPKPGQALHIQPDMIYSSTTLPIQAPVVFEQDFCQRLPDSSLLNVSQLLLQLSTSSTTAQNNEDAASKGVPVGGWYHLPGDPAILCVRTH